jgi:hypothetical protein
MRQTRRMLQLALAVLLVPGCALAPWRAEDARIERGLEVAPVPLDLAGKDRRLVGLGSYIVNTEGVCYECHTMPPYLPGGSPYYGQPMKIDTTHYLAGGMEFPPVPLLNPVPITSRNITPDEHGNPAGMDFPTFVNAMRNGMRYRTADSPLDYESASRALAARPAGAEPQPGVILEVMPWPAYRMMTDHDLRAVYEYLRAVPHAEPGP